MLLVTITFYVLNTLSHIFFFPSGRTFCPHSDFVYGGIDVREDDYGYDYT
jgi:hypothetical protein